MANLPAYTPILLCPLRIETRFVDTELWIRVFPDDFLLESHKTTLSKEEILSAKSFKQQTSVKDKKTAWENLVAQYGAYRAAYLVHLTDQEIMTEILGGSSRPTDEQTFSFRCLPDKLSFFLYQKNSTTPFKNAQGKIPTGKSIPQKGLIAFGEGDEWLSNFDIAIEKGMGIKIPLNDMGTSPEFDRIIVTGMQGSASPEDGSEHLERLIKNHQYHDGFSILEYGTPTNNFESLKSGASPSDEFDAEQNFTHSVLGAGDLNNPTAAGNVLSTALGIESSNFSFLKNASLAPPPLHTLYQKATWFSMGANTLRMLFADQISVQQSEQLWNFYSNSVHARGPFPTLKVGNQPYALLPVTSIRNAKKENNTFFGKLDQVLESLFESWMNIVRNDDINKGIVHRMDNAADPFQSLLEILSMQVRTNDLEIQALSYDRIRGRLHAWLQNAANIPTALSRLPLTQVYELLQGQPETAGFLDDIQVNIEALQNALPDNLTSETRQSPILTFKKNKTYAIPQNGDLKLVQKDLSILNNILEKVILENQTELVEYSAKDISIFVELLLKSFVNAQRLYHRTIYFKPTNSELKGFKHLRIGSIKKAENKSASKDNTVLTIIASKTDELKTDKTFNIKTPISGTIERMYVASNETVEAGYALFRISNKTNFSRIVKEMKSLAKAIIELNATEAEQLEALCETHDLNSHRLDAWITGVATQRIKNTRQDAASKTGILMGVYGWVEHLKKDTQKEVTTPQLLDTNRLEDGGIIHCPSPAQAMTATLFKNSFLSYYDKKANHELGGNPFALNLTSDRIQKSNWLMEGIREDESVEALLGYRLEKELHEAELYEAIYILRKYFPLEVNIVNQADENVEVGFTQLSVINGLKAVEWKEAKSSGSEKDELTKILEKKYSKADLDKINNAISNLVDVLDGSLDNLFFEAGYQLAQGNIPRSAAAMQATKGEIAPPETSALKTKLTGTGIQHTLALLFSPPTKTFHASEAKAFVEPVLETWLADQIGSMKNIGCTVDIFPNNELSESPDTEPIETISVRLSDLKIGYLDFIFMPENELEIQIVNHVKVLKNQTDESFAYKITSSSEELQSLDDALEVKEYILSLWKKSRALSFDDLSTKQENITIDADGIIAIKIRLEKIISKLKIYQANPVAHLKALSQFNIQYAKQSWLYREVPDLETLKAAIQKKITITSDLLSQYDDLPIVTIEEFKNAFQLLETIAKTLFGKAFILLPPVFASNSFAKKLSTDNQNLLIGSADSDGQQRIQQWVQELAQVKTEVTAFEDWQMVQTAWQEEFSNSKKTVFKIVQFPTENNYPWVGLSKSEIDKVLSTYPSNIQVYQDDETGTSFPKKELGKYYPDGSESMVFHLPDDLIFSKENKPVAQYGMVITSFAEHIPDEKITTGLSFHYNAPNSEAPQALLLAAASDKILDKGFWEIEDVNDILYDTLDLAKVRMVDPETLQKYGFILPMTWWFNIPTVN